MSNTTQNNNATTDNNTQKPNTSYTETLNKIEENEIKVSFPVTVQDQIITSVATTAISLLPIGLKLFNSTKTGEKYKLNYNDVIDLMIYRIPDLYQILRRMTYTKSKVSKIIEKGKILAYAATLTPAIRNIIMQQKTKGTVDLNAELITHLVVFCSETLLPLILKERHLKDVATKIIGPGVWNWALDKGRRSNNPAIQELCNISYVGNSVKNSVKTILHSVTPNDNTENTYNSFQTIEQPKEDFMDKAINMVANIINPGRNNNNYYNGYGYNNGYNGYYVPYNGAAGVGSSNPWGDIPRHN